MRPRRVLHVLATAQEEGAAISRVVGALAQALDPARYQLHAWFLGGDGLLAADLRALGIPVRTFEWSGDRSDLVGAWSFWRSLRRECFSIVHMHFGGRVVPFLVRSATRTKIVLHLHGSGTESGDPGPLLVRPWAADKVIALSHAVARLVVGMQPRVVYHGIQIPEEACGLSPGLSRHHTLLGTAGRLVPVKGIVHLIRALACLHHEFPHVHLEVAGAGPEQAALHDEVKALQLDDRVTFLGWLPDMRPVFARWDIFVQPSLDEGFGMAALEAMAAGLPVVGTSVGGLPELIEDGRTGYIVPPADVAELAARLRELLLDAERRRAMGAAGRARVRDSFSRDRMAAELVEIYEQLLARPA